MTEILDIAGAVLGATLRTSTPLVFCALAGLMSERAGLVDIGIEGKMLAAAFAAACLGALGQPAIVAVGGALLVAMALSWVHGFACITHRGDQIVSGVAINLIATGLTMVIGLALFNRSGRTPNVVDGARFGELFPSAADAVRDWPVIGPLLSEGVLRHDALVWLSLACVGGCWWVLYRTRFGLRLRAVGENPATVDAAGVSVASLRYRAALISGALCGLAGAHLTLALNASFTPGMTAGRGFMALAAMVFGKWHPVGALRACLVFGFLDAVAIRLQGVSVAGVGKLPVELIQALPYLFTVILLAGWFGQAHAPAAIGRPYVKDR